MEYVGSIYVYMCCGFPSTRGKLNCYPVCVVFELDNTFMVRVSMTLLATCVRDSHFGNNAIVEQHC